MKEFWQSRCDQGHRWFRFGDTTESKPTEPAHCPEGHPSVTTTRQLLLDRVELRIRPAARIVDPVTKKTGGEYDFFLVLANLHTDEEFTNYRTYTFAEVLKLSSDFKGLSFDAAKTKLQNSMGGL